MGSAQAFANAWEVPEERIVPYLLDWSALSSTCFARNGDKYTTDDWRQVFDFMTALGIDEPNNNPNGFTFVVPTWERAYVRQPVWRRAIRKISVWFKGTYPDVPKRTKSEDEEWQRRRASVQIVKVSLEEVINRDRTKW